MFGVWGLAFKVSVLGFRVKGLGLWGLAFWVEGLGFRIQGLGFRI